MGSEMCIRDSIIADIKSGSGRLIDSVSDVGGWPDHETSTRPKDSDDDGMPDKWETARGLNPNDASDGNGDDDGDGYTNLEEYLNGLLASGLPVSRP